MLTSNIITEDNRYVIEITTSTEDKKFTVETYVKFANAAATIKKKIALLDKKIALNKKLFAETQQLLEYQVAERDTLKSISV